QRHPEQIAILHRRAARWYEQHGQATEAINHALAAADIDLAIHLIESLMAGAGWYGGVATWLTWLAALSPQVVRSRPRLNVLYAITCMEQNLFAAAEPALQDAEATLDILDKGEKRLLIGEIAAIRSTIAINLGNIAEAITPAQHALQLLPHNEKRYLAAIG